MNATTCAMLSKQTAAHGGAARWVAVASSVAGAVGGSWVKSTQEHTPREKVIRAVTVALLGAGVAFFGYGYFSAIKAGSQADDVYDELIALYALGGARPDPAVVNGSLVFSEHAPGSELPTPEGVRVAGFGMLENASKVNVRFRGDDIAYGWCFRVQYTVDGAPEVSKRLCS